jgi:2-succinyl-6-hydroxy-2,4-cyclohexadiene-1-carboxylate synthase
LSVVVPDAPGHGGSASVHADLWQTADLLAEVVPAASSWAGYSMGGRMALHTALAHPEKVARLVLISTTAGIDDDSERQARRSADDALATTIERDGVEAFIAGWLTQPLFATLPADRAGLQARLANTPAGLASSLRLAGVGTQGPLWGRLGELGARSLPVLLVTGQRDQKYGQHAERMAAAIGPSARHFVVPGAGHACHLERPDVVAAAISEFCPTGTGTGQ